MKIKHLNIPPKLFKNKYNWASWNNRTDVEKKGALI